MIGTYAELTTAINSYQVKTYTATQTDDFIQQAEAVINRHLGSQYRRSGAATITTDSTGVASLPTGFVMLRSIVRNVAGSKPLTQVPWDALILMDPYAVSSDATHYAIYGSTIKVAPVTADGFLAIYDSAVPALNSTTTTNWLLTLAPDIYLTMCQSQAERFELNPQAAAEHRANGLAELDSLVAQGNVAQYGNVEMALDMVTP